MPAKFFLPLLLVLTLLTPARAADIIKIPAYSGQPDFMVTPVEGDKPTTNPAIRISAETNPAAFAIHASGPGTIGGLWKMPKPLDASSSANLIVSLKFIGPVPPQGLFVRLHSGSQLTNDLNAADYLDGLMDGKAHEVVLPLKDFLDRKPNFDPKTIDAVEFRGISWSGPEKNFTCLISEISFDNRPSHALTDPPVPVARDPKPIAADAPAVTADIDLAAPGRPISPYIYGGACDAKVAKAAGMTIVRHGGNPTSTVNWKGGFWSSGADWYFVNNPAGAKPTPPEKRLAAFLDLKKQGLELYQTIPIMGRVAKDGDSVGFDTRKYPDQTSWEGKDHPGDLHPYAGSGRQYIRDEAGEIKKDAKGKPLTRDIPPNPDDVSIEMSPDDQCAQLEFEVKNMGFGTAANGGIKFVALDNEPAIWQGTHKCFKPVACGYDEYWQRTQDYAGRLKKIDPSVKIAGPCTWGWTDLFYSGLDAQLISQGKGTWASPPDFAAHGKVPFLKWWMKNLADYEKKNGTRLVDILDFHFYPQSHGKTGTDQGEGRVQETRVYWDPTFKTTSWMGAETNKICRVIPLLKEWIAESNPGMLTSIGEYASDGGNEISGGVAQAELLGIFAREGLDMAFIWGEPGPNSSVHFGFLITRNPDGKFTPFGDHYLPATVSSPEDVSVHTGRDTATGRLSFILINKRASKDARVTLKLSKPLPAQSITPYEYSSANRRALGQLPALKVSGNQIEVNLPAMSILRLDATP